MHNPRSIRKNNDKATDDRRQKGNEQMIKFTYQVQDPNGMHARPAGKLATFAKQFKSEIRVRTDEKEADAKRLLSLMSLGARGGATLTFSVTGEDEQEAADKIMNYLKHPDGDPS